MSDRMQPLSFPKLMTWIAAEYQAEGTIFAERPFQVPEGARRWILPDGKPEMPFGPAAGPHTQLAQNIVAAYVCGSRFFELKTVQKLDGEDLPVSKPCILAADEGYNVEWSTELYVDEAFEEYVKAWFALHVLAIECRLGSPDGFVFNMSVGYDLEGIRSPKIDRFIEGLKDASETGIFRNCKKFLLKQLHNFRYLTKEDIEAIPATICSSITLSTLHGCPAAQIEEIATYLLKEKGLHTFIKCNPTLLGYDFARTTLNNMGYGYVSFTDFHFKDDLQYADAVPMLKRLQEVAESCGLHFGVKLTNTFPVQIKASELPGEEMYMSGRALYPLSIALAAKLAKDFDGSLPISYSGGADIHNIFDIVNSGIAPVTIATTLLKPGGYARMKQIAAGFNGIGTDAVRPVSYEAIDSLAKDAKNNAYFKKNLKVKTRHNKKTAIPFLDCFLSPCHEACPIGQEIPAYMELVDQGRYEEALQLIMAVNPLPFTTGTICPHRCMDHCTRTFYETPVQIRQSKKLAAINGYEAVYSAMQPAKEVTGKIAVIGGGPAGMAAAFFLSREGKDVTLITEDTPGGIPMHVIPDFRIAAEDVAKDVSFLEKIGVKIRTHERIDSPDALSGYDTVILAVGASKSAASVVKGDPCINAITFLRDYKKSGKKIAPGKHIAVIGGGNTAMDTARAAVRAEGVESVSLVYRRDIRNMSADEEELQEALKDGVALLELLGPVSFADGRLKCEVMELGEPDASGRRSPVPTGRYKEIEVDAVITATGERVDGDFYQKLGISLNERSLPVVNPQTMESDKAGWYVIGDGRRGPATVVEAIADARKCAEAILSHPVGATVNPAAGSGTSAQKGVIVEPEGENDFRRCLNCGKLCENCVDVCPNRANVGITVVGMKLPQVIHVDRLCNECGNCETFCPYEGKPYREKLTLFETFGDMEESTNNGFCFEIRKDAPLITVRLFGKITRSNDFASLIADGVEPDIVRLIEAVYKDYRYLYTR